ncbi:penicillin-binding protein [Segeticoccus rhizosphaerae]|uniref:penicillin-binding protein n=1 Tax=Segeticoccus rhizosphaerae TaxID=1104777 RepID=UPI0010C0C1A4|nr:MULTISPECIES: penicillin-binding protein [Intrasporangiaceae]
MQRQATKLANVLSLLGAFLATAVVIGLLGAGLVIPAVGATGAATREGVGLFDGLPGNFSANPLAQQSKIYAADGSLIATPADEDRTVVPLKEIAPVMRKAQVAIEDSRFYEHGGIDLRGVARALAFNAVNPTTQGASTLTQQFVKVSLQENALASGNEQAAQEATARHGWAGIARKVQELKYAVTLEKKMTKDQILEGYLNLVYYGDQAYGVEAAARHYFGIHASQLSLPQAALLAGVVNQPGVTDPIHYPEAAVKRRNVVLAKMHQQHMISTKAWKQAKTSKLQLHVTNRKSNCAASPHPYFCSYVIAWLKQQPALGKTVEERDRLLNRGGLTIKTTLDPKIEKIARRELLKAVPMHNKLKLGAAAAMIQPGTGHVLAIAQNTKYSLQPGDANTTVNYAIDERYGSSGGFQIGSTAKLFTITTALESGMPIDSTIYVRPPTAGRAAVFTPQDFPKNKCGGGMVTDWEVANDIGTFTGRISLTKMTAESLNTAFAELVSKLGTCKIQRTMTRMGLHQGNGEPVDPGPASITLGTSGSSPMSVASAFATIAAHGKYCTPTPVLSITTPDGKKLPIPGDRCKQVLEPDVANGVTSIFTHVLDDNGTARGNKLADKRPAAGKTGTTDGGNESWFTGFTPQLATSVWVGTPKTNNEKVKDFTLAGKFHEGWLFGSTIAAPTWKAIMDAALQGEPIKKFEKPSPTMVHGKQITVPSVTGMPLDEALKTLKNAGFNGREGHDVYSDYPQGTVAEMDPTAGTKMTEGDTVWVYPSTGYVPAPPPPPAPSPTSTPAPSPTSTPAPSPTSTPAPTTTKPSTKKTKPGPKKPK